ncbi:MAG: carboxypeptidase-like regulatory domain-containing protein [Flavobacteriaceae bacterium]|nr:carboxypeptidase-like regulatory domain-containing protein [Flavobacteriaceae bacterium]
MINKLIIIVLFLYNINLLAQESLLKGVIVDSESKIPVSGANISILNSSIGTISNSEGRFLLNIPKNYKKEIVIFSFIGYESLKFDISSFKNDSLILLNPSAMVLDEIIISTFKNSLTANEIIQKAFDNYDKNFPTKQYIAKGFLRHVEKNKKEYKWLVESAITLYDNSEKHNDAIIKINVDEIRKSYDLRNLDSLYLYQSYLIAVRNMGYRVFNKRVILKPFSFSGVKNSIT